MLPSPKSALPCLAKTSKHGGHWIDTTQLFSENLIVTSGPMRSGFSEAFGARVLSTLEDLYGIAGGKSDKDLHDLYVDNWCRRNLEHIEKLHQIVAIPSYAIWLFCSLFEAHFVDFSNTHR